MYKLSISLLACCLLVSCGEPNPATATPEGPEQADQRAALAAGSALAQPVVASELLSCEPMAGMTPYCGYQNPEDLAHIPDTDLLLVSEMGEFMADTPGKLSLLNMDTGQRAPLAIDWSGSDRRWGEESCTPPDSAALSPHGIDLVARDDGDLALLVVNHGGRESVEFFAVAATGNLSWRGCVIPPADAFLNDVAARRDGGFYVTHMWNKSADFAATAQALQASESTGWVWAWTQNDGFTELPGTKAQMPNGIAINADNTRLYVNVYFGPGTFVYDLEQQNRTGNIEARQPDNVTIDADGSVWVASHQHDPIGQACGLVTEGPCLLPFQILRTDPKTLERDIVIDHDGAPMGYATVALRVGNRIYLGSAHGDRIVSIELGDS